MAFDNNSKLYWKGLSSQKFSGSRRHFNIGESLNTVLPSLGKKHYEEKYDRPKVYKSSIKVFPDKRNAESHDLLASSAPKKLIYVPAQKKFKPFKLKISNNEKYGKTIKVESAESSKMKWKEKERVETMREDQKSVYELNEWEHKIRKLLDPFYVANKNDEENDE